MITLVKGFLKHWIFWFWLPFGGAFTLAVLSTTVNPHQLWPLFVFGYVAEYLLYVNILFLIYFMLRKKWYFILPLAILLFGGSITKTLIQWPWDRTENSNQPLKIMSFNLQMLRNGGQDSIKANRLKLVQMLLKEQPKVVCFQEFSTRKRKITDSLDIVSTFLRDSAGYPYLYFEKIIVEKRLQQGLCIASKYPIVNTHFMRFNTQKSSLNAGIYADIQLPGLKARVYNVHLESNRLRPQDYYYLPEGAENNEKTFNWIGIVKKIKHALIKRALQAVKIDNDIQNCTLPVVVCGDLNDPPCSYAYHTVRGNLLDTFVEKGEKRSGTYIGPMPSFRIDHIFVSNQFKVLQHKVLPYTFSDHKPVQAIIAIN